MDTYYNVVINVVSALISACLAFYFYRKDVLRQKDEFRQELEHAKNQTETWTALMRLQMEALTKGSRTHGLVNPTIFPYLVRQWKEATQFMSSPTAMVELATYRAIVQMGASAIPLILAEMEREPDWWFDALWEITGENPVKPEDAGDVIAMTNAWLEWGRVHEYRKPVASQPLLSETNAIQ